MSERKPLKRRLRPYLHEDGTCDHKVAYSPFLESFVHESVTWAKVRGFLKDYYNARGQRTTSHRLKSVFRHATSEPELFYWLRYCPDCGAYLGTPRQRLNKWNERTT